MATLAIKDIELHKKLKRRATYSGVSLQELTERYLRMSLLLRLENIDNKTTFKEVHKLINKPKSLGDSIYISD